MRQPDSPETRSSPELPQTAEPADRPSLWHSGLGSIRGRMRAAIVVFALIMLLISLTAQWHVDQSADTGALAPNDRLELRQILFKIGSDLWSAETSLQGYLLNPGAEGRDATQAALTEIQKDIDALSAINWTEATSRRERTLTEMREELDSLQQQITKVMAIRVDASKLYPALSELIAQTLPLTMEFRDYSGQAMQDSLDHWELSGQPEIYRRFGEARYHWVVISGNFRAYIMAHLGILVGDTPSNLKQLRALISDSLNTVNVELVKLNELSRRGQLQLVQDDALVNMVRILRDWRQFFLHADSIYTARDWRSDVPLLRDEVGPRFHRLWRSTEMLQADLEQMSEHKADAMTSVSDRLSRIIWMITAAVIGLTLLGYGIFERAVRRPIRDVAQALKDESLGQGTSTLRKTDMVETRDLIEAFDYMRQQVASRQQRLESILHNAAEGILTFDDRGQIETSNPAAQRLFGWDTLPSSGLYIQEILAPRQEQDAEEYIFTLRQLQFDGLTGKTGEITAVHSKGWVFPLSIKISPVQLRDRRLYTALVEDISERRALMAHLRAAAEHDGLTGLHNRNYFTHELERVVERVNRSNQHCALLYIDLDNFKYINDTLGHAAGDRLLIETSEILGNRVRGGDLLCRLGGDEFTVLLYDTRPEEIQAITESFRSALAEHHFWYGAEQLDMSCSIGAAMIHAGTRTAEEVLSRADFACHMAKRQGRNCVHVFEDRDVANVAMISQDMGWSRRIRDAIENDRFVLVIQPIQETRHRSVTLHEVLVRIRDDVGGTIMPSGFLPVAERFGLAAEIDRWVIQHSIVALAAIRRHEPHWRFAINLSGASLGDKDLANMIRQKLEASDLEPSALTFEITETMAIADIDKAERLLSQIKEIGCATALDDFGSGMSSFAYLRDLPVDYVKIDGRFVSKMAHDPVDEAMVRAMNDIAHALGKQTVAEYVENEAILTKLVDLQVDFLQGYHIGRPVPLTVPKTPRHSNEPLQPRLH